jgi:hypothetical protein
MLGRPSVEFSTEEAQHGEYERVVEALMVEFPDFKIVAKKDSKLMKAIDVFLKLVTFGFSISFMSGFTTTIGYTVYTPSTWDDRSYLSRAETLRHESVHMQQLARMGWPGFLFMYLIFVLPGGLALGRFLLESEAYEESLRAVADYYGVEALRDEDLRKNTVGHFVGAEYFWMWPFRKNVERWYDEFVSELERLYLGN